MNPNWRQDLQLATLAILTMMVVGVLFGCVLWVWSTMGAVAGFIAMGVFVILLIFAAAIIE